MGYRVEYDSVKKVRGVQKRTAGRLAMTGVFFLVFLVLVACFWPEGASILRDALLPGDRAAVLRSPRSGGFWAGSRSPSAAPRRWGYSRSSAR